MLAVEEGWRRESAADDSGQRDGITCTETPRTEFGDRVRKFATLLRIRFELAKPVCPSLCSVDAKFDQLVKWFMKDACSFFGIDNAGMGEIFMERSEIVEVYKEVFRVFCAILR